MVAIVSGNSVGLSNSSAGTLGQNGAIGNAASGNSKELAYINIATGNMSLQDRDDYVAAKGINVALTRTYNSQGTLSVGNGPNWQLGVRKQVTGLTGTVNTAGSTVSRIDGDGSIAAYSFDASRNAYVTTDGGGAYQTMTYDAATGQWTWRADHNDRQGVYETYAGIGGLILTTGDQGGARLSYFYEGSQLVRITDASADTTHFDYLAGNLVRTRTVLAGTSQEASRVSYTYDTQNRLKTVTTDLTPELKTDAKVYVTTYTYVGTTNQIDTVAQSDGTSLTFAYQLIDGKNKVISVTDALARKTAFDYSIANKTTVTDHLGLKTVYAYDAKGQLLTITAPTAGTLSQITEFEYDGSGNVARTKNARGFTTVYGYDANGNRNLERDLLGNTITRVYATGSNLLLSETRYVDVDTDGAGSLTPTKKLTTRYAYDSANRLRFSISAEGRVQEYVYNSDGQPEVSLTYIDATISDASPESAYTFSAMTAWSQGTSVKNSRVARVANGYDARGLVNRITTYSVTAGAAMAAPVGDPYMAVVLKTYDHAGQLLQSIDGNNNATTFTYDGIGRLLTTKDALGNVELHSYDDVGNRTTTTRADGVTKSAVFDKAGQLTALILSEAGGAIVGQTSYQYDGAGRLRAVTDPNGARSFMLYDEAGRKVADVTAAGSLTEYRYLANNLLAQTIAYASPVSASALAGLIGSDGKPKVLTLEQAAIRPVVTSADKREWRLYDSADRLTKSVDALGAVTDYVYDGASRMIESIQRATPINIETFAANPVTVNATAAPSVKDQSTRNAYDKDGKLRFTLDGEGYISELKYDGAGAHIQTVRYTVAASMATRAAADWQLAPIVTSSTDIVTSSAYNGRGLVSSQIDGAGNITAFTYDADGKLLTQTIANVVTRFVYDKLGRCIEQHTDATGSNTTTKLVYDSQGNRIAAMDPNGAVTQFVYDANNRLVFTIDSLGAVSENKYDADGNVIETVRYAKAIDQLVRSVDGSTATFSGTTRVLFGTKAEIVTSKSYTVRGRVRQVSGAGSVYLGVATYDAAGALIVTAAGGMPAYAAVNNKWQTTADGWQTFEGTITGDYDRASATYEANKFFTGGKFAAPVFLFGFNGVAGTDGTVRAEVDYVELVDNATGNVINANSGMTDGVAGWTGAPGVANVVTVASVRALLSVDTGRDAHQFQRFDSNGRVIWSVDATGAATQFYYDANGNVVSRIAYTHALSATAMAALIANPAAIPMPGNGFNATNYFYDANNRLVFAIDAMGAVTETRYDANGKVTDTVRYAKALDPLRNQATDGNTVIVSGAFADIFSDYGAIDTSKTYSVRARVRQVSGSGFVYLGVAARDAQGYFLSNPHGGGSYPNAGVNGSYLTPEMGWKEFEGTISGEFVPAPGAYDPHKFYAGSKFAAPILQTSYNGQNGADGTMKVEVDYVELVDVATGQVLNKNSSMTNGSTGWNGAVGTANVLNVAKIRSLLQVDAVNDAHQLQRYDNNGRVTWSVDATGAATQLYYDANGNVVSRIAYTHALSATAMAALIANPAAIPMPGNGFNATNYVYDANNRLVFAIDAMGAVTETRYDANGDVTDTVRYAKALDPLRNQATDGNTVILTGAFADFFSDYGAIDTSKTYSVRARVRQVSGAGFVYLGTAARDAQGSYVTNPYGGGTYPNAGVNGFFLTPEMGWKEFEGTISGEFVPAAGAYDPHKFLAGSKFAAPILQASYDGQKGADGTIKVEVDYVELVDVATGQVLNKNSSMTSGSTSWNGAVGTSNVMNVAKIRSLLQVDAVNDAHQLQRYDNNGRVTWSVDATGAATQLYYDANGNVVSRIAYTHALSATAMAALIANPAAMPMPGNGFNASNYVYDANNRLVFAIDAMGAVTETRYDANGKVTDTVRYAKALDPLRNQATDGNTVIVSGAFADIFSDYGAIDTSKTYSVRARVRQVSGSGFVYLGVAARDAQGYFLSNPHGGGSYPNAGVNGSYLTPEMGWKEFEGTISSEFVPAPGAYDPHKFYAGSKFAAPILQTSYNGQNGADGTMKVEVDYVELVDVATGQVLNKNSSMTNGSTSWNGAVGTGNVLSVAKIRSLLQVDAVNDAHQLQRYDNNGRVTWNVDAAGAATQLYYDANGNVVSRIAYTHALSATAMAALIANPVALPMPGNGFSATNYVYDANNRLVFAIDAMGAVTETRYDADGKVTDTVRYAKALAPLRDQATDGNTVIVTGAFADIFSDYGAIDTSKTYSVRARVRQVSGAGFVYLGVAARDAQGYFLSNPHGGGSYPNAGVNGSYLTPEMGWKEFEGTISGEFVPAPGAYDPHKFYAGSKFAAPILQTSYDGQNGADGTMKVEVDYVELVDVATGQVLNKNSSMTNGSTSWNGAVGTANVLNVAKIRSLLQVDAVNDAHQLQRYDNNGRVTWNVDATGAATQLYYDANGNVVSRIAYTHALSATAMAAMIANPVALPMPGNGFSATNYVYDANNRLVFAIDAMGAVTETRYDADGKVTDTVRYAKALSPLRDQATDGNTVIVTGAFADIFSDYGAIDTSKTYSVRARVRQVSGSGYVYLGVAARDAQGYFLSNPHGGGSYPNAGVNGSYLTPEMGWKEFEGTISGEFVPAPGAYDPHKFYAGSKFAAPILQTSYNGQNGADGTMKVEVDYVELVDVATGQVLNKNSSMTNGSTSWNGAVGTANVLSVAKIRSLLQVDAVNDAHQLQRYDANGRVTWSVDATGAATQLYYDANGNVVSRIAYTHALSATAMAALVANPAAMPMPGNGFNATNYVYDANNRLVFAIDAMGAVTETRYDANGKVTDTVRYAKALDPLRNQATDGNTVIVSGAFADIFSDYGAIDTSKTYSVRARVRQVSGSGFVYLGVAARDAQGYFLSNPHGGGSYPNAGVNGSYLTPEMGWKEFEGTISSEFVPAPGAYDPHKFYAGSKFAAPILQTSYNGQNGADGTMKVEVDYVELVDVATGQVLNKNSSMTNGSTGWNGAVGTANVLNVAKIRSLLQVDAVNDAHQLQRYDNNGRLTWSVDATGAATQLYYDASGNVVSRIAYTHVLSAGAMATLSADPAAMPMPGNDFNATNYVYDANNRLVFTIDAMGAVTETRYDANGKVTETVRYAKALNPLQNQATDGNTVTVTGAYADIFSDYGAIDTSKTYSVRARVRQISGSGYVYLGVAARDAQGNFLSNSQGGGSYPNAGVNGFLLTSEMGWKEFEGTISGEFVPAPGAYNPHKFYAGSKFAAPILQTSYNGQNGADGTMKVEVDYIEFVDVATGQVLNKNSSMTNGSTSWNGAVGTANVLNVAKIRSLLQVDAVNDAHQLQRYDNNGRVTWSVDATGAATQLEYDASDNVVRRTAYTKALSSSAMLALAASSAAVPVPDADCITTNYVYDAGNRLVYSVDGVGAVTETKYDASGNVSETIRYATLLSPPAAMASDIAAMALLVKPDVTRDAHTYRRYDDLGRPVLTIDEIGAAKKLVYDVKGNITSRTEYATPMTGGAIAPTTSAGDRITHSVYDAAGRLRFSVNAEGYVTQTQYDAAGYIGSVVVYAERRLVAMPATVDQMVTAYAGKSGRVSSYTYDARGNVRTSTDPESGKMDSYTYDARGNKETFTNKLGATWNYYYDALGRLLREIGPPVTVDSGVASAAGVKWSYAIAAPTAKERLVTEFTYGALGNVTSRIEAAGRPDSRTTIYKYDTAGRQTVTIHQAVNVYDVADTRPVANAAPRSEKDVGSLTVTVTYNALGQAISSVSSSGDGTTSVRTQKGYDKQGNVILEMDALGYLTSHDRDAFGRAVVLTRFAVAVSTAITLDGKNKYSDGLVVLGGQRSITTQYDKLDRVVRVIEANISIYDQTSLRASQYTSASRISETVYNAFGDVESQLVYGGAIDGENRVTAVTAAAITRNYYNALGQVSAAFTKVTAQTGYLTTYEYNFAGNLEKQIEYGTAINWSETLPTALVDKAIDRETSYQFDANNLKKSETVAATSRPDGTIISAEATTSYGYDGAGNQVRVTDPEGGITYTYYNAVGHVIAIAKTNPAFPDKAYPFTEFKLDAHGNVLLRIDYANGVLNATGALVPVVATSANDRRTASIYDRNGHVLDLIDANGNKSSTSYDLFGRVAKQWRTVTGRDINATWEILYQVTTYDAVGQAISVESPGNVNLLATDTSSRSTVVTNVVNAFGEVTKRTVLSKDGTTDLEYTDYDGAGRAWRTNSGDGVDKIYMYDGVGRVSIQCRSQSDTQDRLRTLQGADGITYEEVIRTETRYDLMGRAVDVSTFNAPALLRLNAATATWDKVYATAMASGDLIVIAGPDDKDKAVTVQFRVKGTLAWSSQPERVQTRGDNRAFDTANMARAEYEFRVFVQAPGEPAVEVSTGAMTLTGGYGTIVKMVSGSNKQTLDRWGNVVTVVDARNANWKTQYTYNVNNQVVDQYLSKGYNVTATHVETNYDKMGRVTKTIDGEGHVNAFKYQNGYLVQHAQADGYFMVYKVDVFGQRTDSEMRLGENGAGEFLMTYAYDAMGNQIRHATSKVAIYGANAAMTAVSLERGEIVDLFEYDQLGRRIRTSNTSKANEFIVANHQTNTIRYDLGGNVISTINVGGVETETKSVFDAFNHKIEEKNANGDMLSYKVNAYGRVLYSDDLARTRTTYTYNGAGQLTAKNNLTRGQSLKYSYAEASGQLTRIVDSGVGTTAVFNYDYDRAGNRIAESMVNGLIVYQDQLTRYDTQGRIQEIKSKVAGANYLITYEYDNNGNRKHVVTKYTETSGVIKTIDMSNGFDLMNRQTSISGTVTAANVITIIKGDPHEKPQPGEPLPPPEYSEPKTIVTPVETQSMTYDGMGNRRSYRKGTLSESYEYDAAGRLSTTNGQNARLYDAAGRIVRSFDATEIHVNAYDKFGRLTQQRNYGLNNAVLSDINYTAEYTGKSGYDAVGNLNSYRVTQNGGTTTYTIKYKKINSYLEEGTSVYSGVTYTTRKSSRTYDVNGNIAGSAMDGDNGQSTQTFTNDVDGHVLKKFGLTVTNSLFVNGNFIGSSSKGTETFSSGFEPVHSAALTSAPTIYTVKAGDTLTSIAKEIWGDESLWFVIAQANGVENGALTAGMTLRLPAKANTVNNNYATFKPYDTSAAIGDTTPTLPMPAAPSGGGCGGIGLILMIVVAVVVTVYTAGAAASYLAGASGAAGAGGAGLAATAGAMGTGGIGAMAAGGMVAAGTTGLSMGAAMAAGAIGGAMGSVASQLVGMAIGMQEKFSWKSVAFGALGGGVSAGVASGFVEAGWSTVANAGNPLIAGAKAMVSGAITQGIGASTGLVPSFSWRNVAAASVGAMASTALGPRLGSAFNELGQAAGQIARDTISGIVSGTAVQLVKGGKIDMRQIATDAFGNALGSAIAAAVRPITKEDHINNFRKELGGLRANLASVALEYGDYDKIPLDHPALLAVFETVKRNKPALEHASTDRSKVDGFIGSFESNAPSSPAVGILPKMSVEISMTRAEVIYEKTVQGVAIAGGTLAGMAQAAGDMIIGTGKLALDMIDASDYLMLGGDSRFNHAVGGFAQRKQAFENIVVIGKGIGNAVAHPSSALGNALGHTIDGIQTALDQATATEDLSDWFLYGAKVGHATVGAASLLAGVGGLARGIVGGFSQVRSIMQAVRGADVSASPFLPELSVGAKVPALSQTAQEIASVRAMALRNNLPRVKALDQRISGRNSASVAAEKTVSSSAANGANSTPIVAGRTAAVEHAGGSQVLATGPQVYVPDLSHVTGKGAAVRNKAIDSLIKEDFPNLNLTHKPEYSPFLRTGIAQEGAGTQVGKTNFSSRNSLRDVIVHEELHHRWWERGIYDHHPVGSVKEIRFYDTIDRYMRMRGWNE